MKQFEEIDSLPRNIKKLCERFENEDELAEELISKEAVAHKSCISRYNKRQLTRKRKHFESIKENNEQASNFEQTQKVEEKPKRRRRSLKSEEEDLCCFCMKFEEDEDLHKCQTFSLHEKVQKIAKSLGDHELSAKFSTGDMMSAEAKYHLKCLNDLNNRYRAYQNKKAKVEKQNFIEGII